MNRTHSKRRIAAALAFGVLTAVGLAGHGSPAMADDGWGVGGCPADLDASGIVDGADLVILMGQWGTCLECSGDLTKDGFVDQDDVDELTASWGCGG